MNLQITMGNDEFILYIRKNYNCSITNPQLGKLIWIWIREQDANAQQIMKDQPCKWGDEFDTSEGTGLPKTATQFAFDRALLPELYNYLSILGQQ
jgi:hypothetical protein